MKPMEIRYGWGILAMILILAGGIGRAAAGSYRLPDTGQIKCYDNEKEIPCPKPGEPFYGQDANYAIHPMSFTKLDGKGQELPDSAPEWAMVRDNNTGLVWEVKTDDGGFRDKDRIYSWHEAHNKYIERLNRERFGGYSDWRLPAIDELISIVDYGNDGSDDLAINTRFFPYAKNKYETVYWSSVGHRDYTYRAFQVSFAMGDTGHMYKKYDYSVRAVRGPRPKGNFVDNGDGTVTDEITGLMWQKADGGEMTWEDALTYCENLNLAGYSDWRLPTIKELASLCLFDRYTDVLYLNFFKTSALQQFSSTTSAIQEEYAWYIYNTEAQLFAFDKTVTMYSVRAVRGGRPEKPEDSDRLTFWNVNAPNPVNPAPAPPIREDNTPPEIYITQPEMQRGVDITEKADRMLIRGVASDDSGVAAVWVNNEAAKLSDDGFEGWASLKIGDNLVTVKAVDPNNNAATKTVHINRPPPENQTAPPTPASNSETSKLNGWYHRQYAVVVGINDYRNAGIPNLVQAARDAKAFADMLKTQMGFIVTELYDDRATRHNIKEAMYAIRGKVSDKDSFLFYFAGHGQGVRLMNKEQEGYLIPYDADVDLRNPDIFRLDDEGISLNRLRRYVQDMKAKHIALILDSCFSGLAMKKKSLVPQAGSIDYYNDLLARKSINILTAGDDHPVLDESPFTPALLNALGRGNIDIHDRDGYATFSQLAQYVKEKVEKRTGRRQRPQFDNLSFDDGDFIFKIR